MTKKELELENARLRGENEALRAQNAVLIEALRSPEHLDPMRWITTGSIETRGTSSCLHDNCPTCHGTGRGPQGPCVHMMSCPCPKCSPGYLTYQTGLMQ